MTRDELSRFWGSLGLRGNHVVVHASLSSLGQVEDGARAVCESLVDAVGDAGTVVMPAFTYAETSSDPSGVGRGRPIAFHPDLPVSREIGAVAETSVVPSNSTCPCSTLSFLSGPKGLLSRCVDSISRACRP